MATLVPIEIIASKIYLMRNVKVMLDRDLAELYGVEKDELGNWRSQFATSNQDIMGLRIPPFVFTEHGILMLSSEKPKKKIGYTVKETQKNLRLKVMTG